MTALSLFSISYLRKREWPGDPPGHGKMWENQFFTLKIWISGPKPAKIDYCTCWGRVWPFQISITYIHTIEVRGAPFPQVIAQTPRKGLRLICMAYWQHFSTFATSYRIFATGSIYTVAQQDFFDPKTLRYWQWDPTNLLWCKKSCVTDRGVQLTF